MMGRSVEQRLGNYHLTRLIGRGGFAEVYYGEHLYLKTPAAIKVLTMQITHDEREKFLIEARIAANLMHRHIVTVLEFGVEHDTPYLVMDYAAQGTLRQHYPRGTTLMPEQIVSYVQQAASALQYTHEQHLIHLDLKPENMLLDGNDTLLLSDFGIAQLVQSTQNPANEPRIVGTVAYMAPEQLRGEASIASDQYALAAVIYEWLCGTPPFRGSFAEVALQHTFVVPQPLQERLPSLSNSKSIAEVVAIGLAKDPSARFKSIESFARAFIQACAMKPEVGNPSVYSLGAPAAFVSVKEQQPPSFPSQVEKQNVRPLARRKVIVGLLAGIGLAGAAVSLAWKPLSQLLTKKVPPAKPIHPASVAPGTTLYTFHGHPAFGAGGIVEGVAWMHDSQHIISAGDNIQIWEAVTGKVQTVYREGLPGSLYINALALSPNGKYIAFAATISQLDSNFVGKIEVFEIETQKIIHVFHQVANVETIALAWSPDNTLLASTDQGTNDVQIWNVATGNLLRTYQGHQNPVHALSWSPDGGLIASADGDPNLTTVNGTVHLWEPTTGQVHMIYSEHTSAVNSVAWSPNGKLLASGSGIPTYGSSPVPPSDNTVRIWGPESKHAQLTYSGHTAPVLTVVWSPNGKFIASASRNRVANAAPIQVWNATSGQAVLQFQGPDDTPYNNGSLALAWSPDARMLASAQSDSSVQIWKVI